MEDFGTAMLVTASLGLFIALLFFVPLWGPQLVFRKLTPEKYPNSKVRFSLQDGFVLTVVLAVVNAILAQMPSPSFGNEGGYAIMMLALCVNLLILLLWINCLQFLAQYGITQKRSRLWMQIVLYPLSTIVIAEIVMGVLMLFSSLEHVVHNGELQLVRYLTHPFPRAAVCLIVFFWLMRYLLRYLFAKFVLPGIEVKQAIESENNLTAQ